jgi:hypothetical protein
VTKVSARAKRFWDKLRDWYGTILTEQFGESPPGDWCEVIDETSNDVLRTALAEVRVKHVTFPPRLPEFESIVRKLRRPAMQGPSTVEQLCNFVLHHRRLTFSQLQQPWKYLRDSDGFCVGVVIPADGERPGYRVMVTDMQAVAA